MYLRLVKDKQEQLSRNSCYMIYKGEVKKSGDWERRTHSALKVTFYAGMVDRIQVSSALNEKGAVKQLYLPHYATVGPAPSDTSAARRLPPSEQGDRV